MKKYCIVAKNDKISYETKNSLLNRILLEYDEENPDYLITIGGDGTLLGAIHKYLDKNPNIIVFGIHTGHLGFFSNYVLSSLNQLIDNINNNSFIVEEAPLLTFKINDLFEGYALNEVRLLSPCRTLFLNVYIDDEKLEEYRGTGLCVSTSLGSTGYNRSLNGGVVDTSMKTLQITEIAGINSNAYRSLVSPIILNESRRITIEASENEEIAISYDNQVLELGQIHKLECYYEAKKIKFAQGEKQSFVNRLKKSFLEK